MASGPGPGAHLAARVWQLSYSSLKVCAGCLSFRRRRKGSKKSPEHTVKQTWAPASQYTVEEKGAHPGFSEPCSCPRSPQLPRLSRAGSWEWLLEGHNKP